VTFGWTWEHIENDLLMPQIRALSKYLRAHPPLHLVVAALAGVKSEPEQPKRETEDLGALYAAFAAAGGQIKTG